MRDKSLDIIKGLACILMILAHSRTLGRVIDDPLTIPFWYLGFFAPILFFASIGISLTYQLKKRSISTIILFNILFFIISFADRGRESLNYFNITNPNLIGSLAIATIFTALFRKTNGLLILFTLILLDRLANRFPILPTIIYGIPFALIPWAGITTLGQYLHENKKARLFILLLGFLITFYYVYIRHQTLENQFLTSLFLGMSLLLYSFVTISAEKIGEIVGVSGILTYLGKNTLLFYWVHLFILFTINFKLPAVFMWLFILSLTIISMVILKKINHLMLEKVSTTIWFWAVLISAVFIPPIFHPTLKFQFYFFSALTIIFALNYHQFFKLKYLQ